MGTNGKTYMEKSRLETLIDGIFAIVMTLMVMTVVVPQRAIVLKEYGFGEMMRVKIHDIGNYALSFALLAIFWIQHHDQAHFIKRTDRVHIWINMAMLFFIALFPFSTSLVTEFPEQDPAEIVFGVNMFIVGMLFLLNWVYATKDRHLVDDNLSDWDIVFRRNKCLFFLFISVASIVLSQVHPSITSDIFWLIPILVVSEHFFKRKMKAH